MIKRLNEGSVLVSDGKSPRSVEDARLLADDICYLLSTLRDHYRIPELTKNFDKCIESAWNMVNRARTIYIDD